MEGDGVHWVGQVIAASNPSSVAEVIQAVVAVFLLVLAVLGLSQVSEVRRARNGQVMADISRRWDGEEFIKSRVAVDKLGKDGLLAGLEAARANTADHTLYYTLLGEANFYEDVALLWDADVIAIDTINKWIGVTLISRWDHWEPTVQYLRDELKDQSEYSNWQSLAEEVRKLRAGRPIRRPPARF